MKLLKEKEIRALRFPGGHQGDFIYLVDNEDVMRSVYGAHGFPEGNPKGFTSLWQFLDFCREADITAVFQVNMLLYSDGTKVYQMAGPDGVANGAPVIRSKEVRIPHDPGKRAKAAKALTALVKKAQHRGTPLKHLEFGNEEYSGIIGANDYADMAIRFIKAIREADPKAMIWVTLGANFCSEQDKKMIPPWAETVLTELQKAGMAKDPNLGFTLHYVWDEYVIFYEDMLKKHGFRPRLAVTEFHMAGLGPYSDLSPRYGYALELARYLISMAQFPSVEIMCIHELSSQNFGIIHYNQHSYGPPGMETWDPTLGYQCMPSSYVYQLFGKLVGGTILKNGVTNANRLVVQLDKERRVFFVNSGVNPTTIRWDRTITGKDAKRFDRHTIVPNLKRKPKRNTSGASEQALGQSNLNVDPLRVDRVEEQKQSGKTDAKGLTAMLPSHSISYIRLYE
jgi:hypothetical protein